VIGLYTNNAGHPGTLLTSGTITAPVAGQNTTVTVPAASVTAGQTYWIAVLGPTGTLKIPTAEEQASAKDDPVVQVVGRLVSAVC